MIVSKASKRADTEKLVAPGRMIPSMSESNDAKHLLMDANDRLNMLQNSPPFPLHLFSKFWQLVAELTVKAAVVKEAKQGH